MNPIGLVAFFLIAGLILLGPTAAQQIISPGDHALRTDRVRLGTDTLVVLIAPANGPRRVVATLFRRISRVTQDGRDLYRETHYYDYGKEGSEYDTLDVEAATLRMRRIVEVQGNDRTDLTFDGLRITGVIRAKGGLRTIDTAAEPFFHDMMDDSFTGMYPFETVKDFQVREIRPPDLSPQIVRFQVKGAATLQTAHGPVDCLVIARNTEITMWVSQRDGHLIRLRWDRPGKDPAFRIPKSDMPYLGAPAR